MIWSRSVSYFDIYLDDMRSRETKPGMFSRHAKPLWEAPLLKHVLWSRLPDISGKKCVTFVLRAMCFRASGARVYV